MVCGVWCVVCGVWCVVCGVWCVVCGVWWVVGGGWCVRSLQVASGAGILAQTLSQWPCSRPTIRFQNIKHVNSLVS